MPLHRSVPWPGVLHSLLSSQVRLMLTMCHLNVLSVRRGGSIIAVFISLSSTVPPTTTPSPTAGLSNTLGSATAIPLSPQVSCYSPYISTPSPFSKMETSLARISLTTILNSLNTMMNVVQLAGVAVPHIHPIIALAVAIVATLQQFRANKRAFEGLANAIHSMAETIVAVVQHRHWTLSDELARYLKEFTTVLRSTEEFLDVHRSRGAFRRFFTAAEDAVKIEDYKQLIKEGLLRFQTQMQMGMFENIVNLMQQRNTDHPPSYAITDVDPVIPNDVRRIAEEDFDRLLPILGVFTVIQEPPSIRQIACVLSVDENSVQQVWGPISSYLDGLDSDGRARCLKFLETHRDGTSSLDASKYHNLVAQWCLTGAKVASSDIFYASDFWVHHVCHASPSLELRDALTKSELPFDSDFRDGLPEIISWLEQIHKDEQEWANLLASYREASSEQPK
ncbi:hypothetical protein C8R44DRAFT_229551 [Mycena epipterygia]|nr:hypothetical protein C8R44DRAFT_229551 [Mycena epipterygia]